METHLHVFLQQYQYFEKYLREHCLKLNLLQLSYDTILEKIKVQAG